MNITKEQFERIAPHFPRQRGNVKIDNFTFITAILYMTENGCKWRALPDKFGNWNSVYRRFERWAENGVMQRIFAALQAEKIIGIHVEILALDSTSCKVHPDAHGALKKEESSPSENQEAVGTPSFMWYPQTIKSSLKCTSRAASATTDPKGGSRSKP
jgi:transposase